LTEIATDIGQLPRASSRSLCSAHFAYRLDLRLGCGLNPSMPEWRQTQHRVRWPAGRLGRLPRVQGQRAHQQQTGDALSVPEPRAALLFILSPSQSLKGSGFFNVRRQITKTCPDTR
jgi:hypothetical protein